MIIVIEVYTVFFKSSPFLCQQKINAKEKRERRGRNPAKDENMILPPGKVVTFKCYGKLRDKVNGN